MNRGKIFGWGAGLTLATLAILMIVHVATKTTSPPAVAAQRPSTTAECPGEVGRKILTEQLVDVSNHGDCRPIFRIENFQNILFSDGRDEFEASVWPDRVVREAKAKTGTEPVYASLCPLWLKGPLEFNCTKKVQTAQTR